MHPDPEIILGPFDRGTAHFDESDLLFRHLAAHNDTAALLVDVGAHHGGSIRHFCEAGWEVHAFEPDEVNRGILTKQLGKLTNLKINPLAVTERDGDKVDFFRSPESSGVSGLSPFLDSHEKQATVETITLATYLSGLDNRHVTYLKIDTEGHDLFVLRSFPWDTDAPDAIECEFEDSKTVPLGYTSDDLATFLHERGYEIVVSEWHPIVRYGIQHDFRELRTWEPGSIHPDSWGNFLAVRDSEALADLKAQARIRGVDVRDRPVGQAQAGPVEAASHGLTYPKDFPNSPSAIPVIAGAAERAGQTKGVIEMASQAGPATPRGHVAQIGRFFRSTTGLALVASLAMIGIGYADFAFSWVIGVAGLGLLGLFLAYRIGELDQRQRADSVAIRGRVNAARTAADTSRSAVGHVHEELRGSIQELREQISSHDQANKT